MLFIVSVRSIFLRPYKGSLESVVSLGTFTFLESDSFEGRSSGAIEMVSERKTRERHVAHLIVSESKSLQPLVWLGASRVGQIQSRKGKTWSQSALYEDDGMFPIRRISMGLLP